MPDPILGRIAAIVPAYNEAGRIASVLEVLKAAPLLDEVVVVDDGSSDSTAEVAGETGVRVVALEKNVGKGGALQAGFRAAAADTYIFIDADLIGLTPSHLEDLVEPLRNDPGLVMVTGMAVSGRLRVDLAQRFFSVLNGQRALRRSFVESLPDLTDARWGVEVLLTRIARKRSLPAAEVALRGLSQIMKEEKDGVFKGVASRLRMYYQVLRIYFVMRGR